MKRLRAAIRVYGCIAPSAHGSVLSSAAASFARRSAFALTRASAHAASRSAGLAPASSSARSARPASALISTSPRRFSAVSSRVGPMRMKRASESNTKREPYASWKSSRLPTVITRSASDIARPRTPGTAAGWSVGTAPRLSAVSR